MMHVEFLWDKAPGAVKPSVLPQGEAVDIRARGDGAKREEPAGIPVHVV